MRFFCFLIVCFAGAAAQAAPIFLQNPSFEADAVPDGAFIENTVTGWVVNGDAIDLVDKDRDPHSTGSFVADGEVAATAQIQSFISQDTGVSLLGGERYELSATFGARVQPVANGFLALYANGSELARLEVSVAAGTLSRETLTYTAPLIAPAGTLEVRIGSLDISTNAQITFDLVSLEGTAGQVVTAPAGALFLVTAVAALAGHLRTAGSGLSKRRHDN